MKVLRYFCLALMFVMLAGSISPVFAVYYSFQVPEESAIVTVNTDGTLTIDYSITFANDSSADPIDIIDIGMPNSSYVLNTITATIDGKSISKITKSDYVSPGISLYLEDYEIPAGGTGTVQVHVPTVKNAIYQGTETESEAYASLMFQPNYFDSSLCYGSTNLQVTFLFPAGLTESEPRYYSPSGGWPGSDVPESAFTSDERIFYTWISDSANAYSDYTFGASFPARVIPTDSINTATSYSPSSGSGLSFNMDTLCPVLFCLVFLGIFGTSIYAATVGAKKRKLKYLPPKISIEGHGIKRGLTPVEAGILMEQPMDKVMTMTLFSLLKKNAAEVTVKEPLTIKAASPLPADLYGYETDFLAAFQETDVTRRRKLLQVMMVNLIKSVGEKMKGFSKKETVAFYENIMQRAWDQVEQAATPEVKGQVYEEVMDWTMLDKKYDDRTREVFSGPVFIPTPTWWWRYDPTIPRTATIGGATAASGGTPSIGGGKTVSLPSLPGSAFAASVVNSVQSFASGVLGNVSTFTSGVTNVTNPIPVASTYRSGGGGSSGGGGHSCACACACAGCACACAGGGR